jgi:hypothetical protein
MKYRIVQRSKTSFEPQLKGCICWNNWTDWNKTVSAQFPRTLIFDTLEEAVNHINKYHEEYETEKYPVIHTGIR